MGLAGDIYEHVAFGLYFVCVTAACWQAQAQWLKSALMWAAFGGHAYCARLLLDAGADKSATDQARFDHFYNSIVVLLVFCVFVHQRE